MAGLNTAGSDKYSWVSNSEIEKRKAEAIIDSRPQESLAITGLVSHVRGVFERHKTGRLDIERRMLRTLRRVEAKYEADVLTAIRAAEGDQLYMPPYPPYTQQKVRDAEAWIIQKINPEIDRTWDIEPEPVAEFSPDIINMIREGLQIQISEEILQLAAASGEIPDPKQIQQQLQQRMTEMEEQVKKEIQKLAEKRSANMEKKIKTQLDEGGWTKAFMAIISDICQFPCCILKGPIFRKKKVLSWVQDPKTGQYTANIKDRIQVEFRRVSPFDWYPAPESVCAGDGDEVELEHCGRQDFMNLIGVPGYKDDVLRQVLAEFPGGYVENTTITTERQWLEKKNMIATTDQHMYDIVEFWGGVPGKLLLEWGIEPEKITDPTLDYQANVKLVGMHCIKAVLNPDPLGEHPYRTTAFQRSNDSQWGKCPADLMESFQDRLNKAARALDKNVEWASQPISEMDKDRCDIPGEVLDVWAGKKIISTSQQMTKEGQAVHFYQPAIYSDKILQVIDRIKKDADDNVVPSFAHGDTKIGGAGNTMGGLSMLMSSAERNILLSVINIDTDITIKAVEKLFIYDMMFLDDPDIKGDCKVKARGAASMMAKEVMAQKRQTYLGQVVANQTLTAIHGNKGVAFMAAETCKSLDMSIDRAIPDYDKIEQSPAGQQPDAQPGGPAGSPAAPPPQEVTNEAGQ